MRRCAREVQWKHAAARKLCNVFRNIARGEGILYIASVMTHEEYDREDF